MVVPKRSNTMETLQLALELLRRIPRGRKVTASQLHEELIQADITRELRTIQRQLDMLAQNFDIERDDREKPYGYCWKSNSRGLEIPALGEQESLLLLLASQHLKHLLPASLTKSLEGLFSQARTNLDSSESKKLARQWLSKVRVVSQTQRLLPPKILPEIFESVSRALYGNLCLEVDYKNASGERSTRNVMPLGLAQQGPQLYLVCRFDGFSDERILALHRIHGARVSTLTFERPKDFDLEKYDNDGRFGFGEGQTIKLTFQVEKNCGAHLQESRLSEDQTIKEKDDWLHVSATVIDSEHLDWWLNGFGGNVRSVRKVRKS